MTNEGRRVSLCSEETFRYFSQYSMPTAMALDGGFNPQRKKSHAMFTLVNTGERDVFVTCYHVLEQLHSLEEQWPRTEIVAYDVGAPCLVTLKGFTCIDYSPKLDIAVFKGMEDHVEIPGRKFIDYQHRRASEVLPGEPIAVVGYPAFGIDIAEFRAEFGLVSFVLAATTVSEQRIVMSNDRNQWIRDLYNQSRQELPKHFGGMSGSPAFRVESNGHYSFAGIFTDSSANNDAFFVSRLTAMKPDGHLDHSQIP